MLSLAAARALRLRGPASGGAANRESRPPFSEPAHTGYPATPYTGTERGRMPPTASSTVGIARGCHHGDHPRGPAQAGGGRPVSVHPGADVDPSRPHGGAGAEASRGVRTPSTGATSGARRGRLSLPRWPSPSARCSHAPDGSGARSNGTSLLTRVEDGPPSAGGNGPGSSPAVIPSCKVARPRPLRRHPTSSAAGWYPG